jgi:hypothetical protein
MKALYAPVFVAMSFLAFAASAQTWDDTTANDNLGYFYDLDDLDLTGETVAQATTRVPGIVIAPAGEFEIVIVDEDGIENNKPLDLVPGIATILPGDEDPTGSFADHWGGY